DADQADRHAYLAGDGACVLETGLDGSAVPEQTGGTGRVHERGLQPVEHLLDTLSIDAEADAARPHQAPAEPAAAQQSGRVEEVAAQPPALVGRRKEAEVLSMVAEITRVIGQLRLFSVYSEHDQLLMQ